MSKANLLRSRISIDPDAAPTRPTLRAAADPVVEPATPAPAVVQPVPEPVVEESTPVPDPVVDKPAVVERGAARAVKSVKDALDDPEILSGRKGYRSFYVDDEVFARFRAAIYWSSRNPAAATGKSPVPLNMSVAIEEWMEKQAQLLEKAYHGGEVFPMPPKTVRRSRAAK